MRALLIFFIVVIAVVAAGVALWRRARARLHERQRAAWHAKREEEDRIWYAKMGDDPDVPGSGAALPIAKPERPDDDESPSRW